ncbi:MAG: prephenate dehydratase [Bacteroidota bacterium]
MKSVAYQGEPGAFSEQAARSFFGSRHRLVPRPTFREVFSAVARGAVHAGIIPIENTLFGSVHQNYDLLLKNRLYIVGEINLRIRIHLMALPGVRRRDLRFVYSHPQALGQCEKFLHSLRGVTAVATEDTAGSARLIRDGGRRDAAALASRAAAQTYGLRILRRSVESDAKNFTRFLVLSRSKGKAGRRPKTSLVFAVRDVPGALFTAIGALALRDINLLKLESRPIVGRPWEYSFYVDVRGLESDQTMDQALNHLKELTTFVRVLGSYSSGKTVTG